LLAVKRDDLTSTSYGGNKVRKLDFLLGKALDEGCTTVLTFGAYGSNHALATAVHARALGLEPHVVLSPQAPGPFAARTLLAHAALGTTIHLVDGWDGRREAVWAKQALVERDGVAPYVIPMGGTNALGAVGYVNAGIEVGDGFDAVYIPAGTLGTSIGLAIGLALVGSDARVEAIRVTPAEICNLEIAEQLTAETIALLRSLDAGVPQLALRDLHFSLRDEFFEPGYGVATPATTAAVEMAAAFGLQLETTYTGKALVAMLADATTGSLANRHVLFWDTYNSAPYPQPGPVEALPAVLRDYVAECDRVFGDATSDLSEGDTE
jgi:D-cysteine desulfhydrase